MANFISEAQSRRFWAKAQQKNHAFCPWQSAEVHNLLKHYGCIDFEGKPSSLRIPLYKDWKPFYDLLCKIVDGPVPDFCLAEDVPASVGWQMKLNPQFSELK